MRHALVRRSFTLACAVALLACGSEDTTGPSAADRTYMLQSVDGQPLPYVGVGTNGDTTAILNEAIVLRSGGRAATSRTVRHVINGAATIVSEHSEATYTLSGDQLTFTVTCAAPYTCFPYYGTLSDAQLTLSELPSTPVFFYTRVLPD